MVAMKNEFLQTDIVTNKRHQQLTSTTDQILVLRCSFLDRTVNFARERF